jgi:hypothetical protein
MSGLDSIKNLPTLGEGRELEDITKEIHLYEAHAQGHAGDAIKFKVEIGKRLTRAKELLKHGDFLPWAEKEFGWQRNHVSKHMRLAANVSRGIHLNPNASLRAALAAISTPDPQAEGVETETPAKPERAKFYLLTDGQGCTFDFRADSLEAAFLESAIGQPLEVSKL